MGVADEGLVGVASNDLVGVVGESFGRCGW